MMLKATSLTRFSALEATVRDFFCLCIILTDMADVDMHPDELAAMLEDPTANDEVDAVVPDADNGVSFAYPLFINVLTHLSD